MLTMEQLAALTRGRSLGGLAVKGKTPCPGRIIHPFDDQPFRIDKPFGWLSGKRKASDGWNG
jgi:hypothetical protein